MKPPLLVQGDLLAGDGQPVDPRWLPMLAALDQAERPLVLLAERPDRWAPTRNRVDRAFTAQAEIEAEIRRAGGALDAIVYLDVGLFSRRRQQRRNLGDLADRYDCKLDDLHALCRPGRIADALAAEVVGSLERIQTPAALESALRKAAR